jgi:PPOX class probable F420-dependent enzyme
MANAAVDFVRSHARAVLITHRRDGGTQASPIRVRVDESGNIVATTRATTAKARNLTRDPSCTLCVVSDAWHGPWLTIEATAEIVVLPDALEQLHAFYLARDGKVDEPADFEETMRKERRIIIHFTPVRTSGTALTA